MFYVFTSFYSRIFPSASHRSLGSDERKAARRDFSTDCDFEFRFASALELYYHSERVRRPFVHYAFRLHHPPLPVRRLPTVPAHSSWDARQSKEGRSGAECRFQSAAQQKREGGEEGVGGGRCRMHPRTYSYLPVHSQLTLSPSPFSGVPSLAEICRFHSLEKERRSLFQVQSIGSIRVPSASLPLPPSCPLTRSKLLLRFLPRSVKSCAMKKERRIVWVQPRIACSRRREGK
jgi:hypothetical protein